MKKKIYIIGVMTVLAITCFGCGKKDAATDRKMAEATTEITTETTEKVTEQADKKKAEKTTEATTEKVSDDKKSEKSDKKKSDSKSDKSKAANTAAQSDKTVTQSANESKPVVTTNSNSSTSSNTSANNTSQTTDNKSQTSSKPQTTECQHDWVAVTHTVHHDAVMGERIVESAVYAHWYCRDCQQYYINHTDDPHYGVSGNGSEASYCLKPAVRETYEVTPAYDETVTDYYKCSKCGATR